MMNNKGTVGIIGFGRFGILTATVLSSFFEVKAYHYRKNKKDEKIAEKIGVKLLDLEEVVDSNYLILAVPISKTKNLIKRIAATLKPETVAMDVCSVKMLPCEWMEKYLPRENEILGTHPMFGPVTTKFDLDKKYFELEDKQIVLCPVRIKKEKLKLIKDFLEKLGIKVIVTTPQNHDEQNAKTLSLVHFLGRSLTQAKIDEQEIFTPGYTDLLKIIPHTNHDDWQLFYDMNNCNPYSEKVRNDFLKACLTVEDKILRSDTEDDFEFNRRMINKIDGEIFSLLEKRLKCVKDIGDIKKKKGLRIVDPKREAAIIENRKKETDLRHDFIEDIYKQIFKESYRNQK